jgi:hypothetical protein
MALYHRWHAMPAPVYFIPVCFGYKRIAGPADDTIVRFRKEDSSQRNTILSRSLPFLSFIKRLSALCLNFANRLVMAKIGLYSRQAYALGLVTRMCPAAY